MNRAGSCLESRFWKLILRLPIALLLILDSISRKWELDCGEHHHLIVHTSPSAPSTFFSSHAVAFSVAVEWSGNVERFHAPRLAYRVLGRRGGNESETGKTSFKRLFSSMGRPLEPVRKLCGEQAPPILVVAVRASRTRFLPQVNARGFEQGFR